MKKILFLYSGEGTKDRDSKYRLIKHSKYWSEIQQTLHSELNIDLEQLWNAEIGTHQCPHSPLFTVICQICLSDLWIQWGYKPDVVLGHSIGELTAAFQAGFYSLKEILSLTYHIGEVVSQLDGVMLHGKLSDQQLEHLPLNVSSLNFVDDSKKHVTISCYADEMDDFMNQHPDFVKMKLPHPWHHPDYRKVLHQLRKPSSRAVNNNLFVSGVTTCFENLLENDHWHRWLVNPIDFIRSMQTIKDKYIDDDLEIIEIGFHPVLDKCCEIFKNYTYVSSMFRGEDEIKWALYQRKKLDQSSFLERLGAAIEEFKPGVDYNASLAYQGFTSLTFSQFSVYLQPYFPSLAPQDFYRYKNINQLIDQFGIDIPVNLQAIRKSEKNDVVISGISCRFPSSIETPIHFWEILLSKADQVSQNPERGEHEAGFLDDRIAKFDHRHYNISEAEALAMDPQQILALELTELLWQDAGLDPNTLNKKRIGVYIGAWNQEYTGDKESVYYPTGTNPSMIASRISYHYDLRGPSWVSNTACSSSLVAIHYAAKDIEDGRVDYAIAGGVNMILGNDFTNHMKKSGFLSKDFRCKVFDNSANGYVRAEGGGLVLLVNKALAKTYYAELLGSSINQNGGRSQLITAPSPLAQEELILDACQDAGIVPQDISYIECHGTGTKIGDPIEISAIQNTIAKDRNDICYVGSVKSNMGHLESAAGIAGLIKSLLILNYGIIPPNLHFTRPNQLIDFESNHLHVVTDETKIDHQVNIGISSFGFGGSNAHIILRGVDKPLRKELQEIEIPFDRVRAPAIQKYFRLIKSESNSQADALAPNRSDSENDNKKVSEVEGSKKPSKEDVEKVVKDLFYKLTNIEEIESDIELTEQGLDSMSGAEFISQLESLFKISIDADILFEYPLRDQLVDEIYALVR
jgi:acyl transferase domain-containing protein/acyl carrier protein